MIGPIIALAGVGVIAIIMLTSRKAVAPSVTPLLKQGYRDYSFVASPHFSSRAGKDIKYIVIHYTAGGIGAAAWFQDPKSKVSAHFVISRTGNIVQTVPVAKAAWHAGVAKIGSDTEINAGSIGIELENYGRLTSSGSGIFRSESGNIVTKYKQAGNEYYEPFTPNQIASVARLVRELRVDFPSIIKVVGHSEIAPGRKIDPGPLFPWSEVRDATSIV